MSLTYARTFLQYLMKSRHQQMPTSQEQCVHSLLFVSILVVRPMSLATTAAF